MIRKQPKTRLEFLDNLVEYFSADTSRRNVSSYNGTTCKYEPTAKGKQGCAIGRYLPRQLSRSLDNGSVKGIYYSEVFIRLPVWLQNFGKDFLDRCQKLHDRQEYWNQDGLTEFGQREVAYIKEKYC